MPKKCTPEMLGTLFKMVKLNLLGDFYNKDGSVKPGTQFKLSSGDGNGNAGLHTIYVYGGSWTGVYYLDFRDLQIYVTLVEDNLLADTRAEAYMVGIHNAQGSAMIAKFMVEFSIGLIAGGAFGKVGALAVTIADITDLTLRWGKDFDQIYAALSMFAEGRSELKAIAPNFTTLLDNVIYNSLTSEVPKAFAGNIAEAFSSPKDLAALIGSFISGLGLPAVVGRLARVTQVAKLVAKTVFEQIWGKLKPGSDSVKALGTAGAKALTLGSKQSKDAAKAIKDALDAASQGATAYITSGVADVDLAAIVVEVSANPAKIQAAMTKIVDGLSQLPEM